LAAKAAPRQAEAAGQPGAKEALRRVEAAVSQAAEAERRPAEAEQDALALHRAAASAPASSVPAASSRHPLRVLAQ
jgi:hypothetical protein